ncbi:MAG: acyl-CoA dehydrogenase family protein [Sneathiella sp.]
MLDEIYFDDSTAEIREMVRRLASDHITPLAEECDAEDRFPEELLPILSDAGLLTMPMPEEYGGINASAQVLSVVLEEIGYSYATWDQFCSRPIRRLKLWRRRASRISRRRSSNP